LVRRGVLPVMLAGIAALGAATALAQQPVVVAQDTRFLPEELTIQQGETLLFDNQDADEHDLTHDAQPGLFATPTFKGPGQRNVEGTQNLQPGSYPFYCTEHPSEMTGTLHVQAGDGPPPAPPQIEVELSSSKLEKVVESRRLKGSVEAIPPAAATDVSLKAIARGERIARKKGIDVASGETRRVRMKLTKGGLKALDKRLDADQRAKVKLVATVAGGEKDTDRGILK
jgi:plastocyanin